MTDGMGGTPILSGRTLFRRRKTTVFTGQEPYSGRVKFVLDRHGQGRLRLRFYIFLKRVERARTMADAKKKIDTAKKSLEKARKDVMEVVVATSDKEIEKELRKLLNDLQKVEAGFLKVAKSG